MAIETVEELRAAYPDLVARIEKEARGETTEAAVVLQYGAAGELAKWTQELRDLDGALMGSREEIYNYYPTGEVKLISRTDKDAAGKAVAGWDILHFLDGRKPLVTKRAVAVPLAEAETKKIAR